MSTIFRISNHSIFTSNKSAPNSNQLIYLIPILVAAMLAIAWRPMPKGPPAFDCSVAAATTGHLLVWGVGFVDAKTVGHTAWVYDMSKNLWRKLEPIREANGIVPVCGDRAVSSSTEIFVSGRVQGSKSMGLVIYTPKNNKWRVATSKGAPSERQEHVLALLGNKLAVWGGRKKDSDLVTDRKVYLYDPQVDVWTAIDAANHPMMRSAAGATSVGGKLVVWGGSSFDSNPKYDGGIFDPAKKSWTLIKETYDAPQAYPFMHAFGQNVFIVGRENECDFVQNREGAIVKATVLDLKTLKFRKVKSQNAPNCLTDSASAGTKSGIAYFGGYDNEVDSSGGAGTMPKSSLRFAQVLHFLDSAKEIWRKVDSSNTPSPRSKAHLFSVGEEQLAMWGGFGGKEVINRGLALSYPLADGATLDLADKKAFGKTVPVKIKVKK